MAIMWGTNAVTTVKWGTTNCTAVYWGTTKVFPTNTDLISSRTSFNQGMYHSRTGISYNNEGSISTTAWTCTARTYGASSGTSGTATGSHYGVFVSKSKFNASLYTKVNFSYTYKVVQAQQAAYYAWADCGIRWSDTNNGWADGTDSHVMAGVYGDEYIDKDFLNQTFTKTLTNQSMKNKKEEKYLVIEMSVRTGQYNSLSGVLFTITKIELVP